MVKPKVNISDHFTFGKLLRFTGPSVGMLVFIALFTVIDGFFVSNFAGKTALAAVNLVWPIYMMLMALGFVFGTGGSALVAAQIGAGKREYALGIFTMLNIAAAIFGLFLTLLGYLIMGPLMHALGAQGDLYDQCMVVSNIWLAFIIPAVFNNMFQSFFATAGKPQLGLAAAIASGATLAFLDYLFIACWGWGIAGAGWATGLSYIVGGVLPIFYFWKNKSSNLRYMKPVWSLWALKQTFLNGLSEFVSNIAMSVVSTLYNFQLMRIVGETGVAAYSAIMYVNFVFIAAFFGFSQGAAPITSYHYGADNRDELKNLFSMEMKIVALGGLVMSVLAQLLAVPIVQMLVGYDAELSAMALHGFRIFAFSFLICGFGIYGSAFFTALNNGPVSALISFMRTLVFESASVMLLPMVLGLDGIWASCIVAEVCATAVAFTCFLKFRKRYGYWRD